jgi:phosphoglycolate phosphatase
VAKLFVFDLDGTLADTAQDLALALQVTLADLGLPVPSLEAVRQRIGNGARNLVAMSLKIALNAEPKGELLDSALDSFLRHYAAAPALHTTAYYGVAEVLAAFPNTNKVVLTNKPCQPAETILTVLKLRPYFSEVIGGDSGFGLKPSPQGLLHLMARHHAGRNETVLIGDGLQDQEVAQAAEIRFIAFLSGFGPGQTLIQRGATTTFSSFDQLAPLLLAT